METWKRGKSPGKFTDFRNWIFSFILNTIFLNILKDI